MRVSASFCAFRSKNAETFSNGWTIQERPSVLAAECASALLTSSSAHSCNPPEAFISVGDWTPTETSLFLHSPLIEVGVFSDRDKNDQCSFLQDNTPKMTISQYFYFLFSPIHNFFTFICAIVLIHTQERVSFAKVVKKDCTPKNYHKSFGVQPSFKYTRLNCLKPFSERSASKGAGYLNQYSDF